MIFQEDLLRMMSSTQTVAPGFRWRRSRWGQTCPVALSEGKPVGNLPNIYKKDCPFQPTLIYLLCSFQDKMYVLSSQEAYQKFLKNPRRYLLPPMPRPPCRVSIIGPPLAGKSTLCKLLAQHYNALVLDLEALVQPVLAKVEQERLDKIKEETTQVALEKIKMKQNSGKLMTEDHPEVQALVLTALEEAKHMSTSPLSLYGEVLEKRINEIEEAGAGTDVRTGWVLDNFPKNVSQMNALQHAGILPDLLFCLKDSDGSQGYPDGPEINDYKLKLNQFLSEWDQMQSASTVTHSVLEIGDKSPEDLLQEIVLQMEKPFEYVSCELSAMDLEKEAEDMEALAELERAEEGSSDNDAAEDEDEQADTTVKRLLGDSLHFCPVALKNSNILLPCTDEIAAKYREKTFYFSNQEARDYFLQNPANFVGQTSPLKPPALRIFLLGTRGSGKTSNGEWLAQQLGLFHIQFREQLQMLIKAKTKKPVLYADEKESSEESPEDLEALIEEARGEHEKETEETSINENDIEPEVVLTEEEKAIKAYLSEGDPLSLQILDTVIAPYWKQEPYKSTGFILEGFPFDSDEVQYMSQRQLFPDLVVIMSVDVTDVQKRLLPTYLESWCERRNRREAQLNLLRDLREKSRSRNYEEEENEEEDEDAGNIEDEIEATLEEEFPLEEDNEDMENEETKEAASERLEMEIAERYMTDETGLATVMELLSELNIPKVSISASRKLRIVRQQMLQKVQPLLTNRESLFQKSPQCLWLLGSIKQYKEKDLIQPLQWPLNTTYPLIFHQYIYFFASKENRNMFMLNPLKYLRESKPSPSLPVKIAVVGPPKSGTTTGKAQNSWKIELGLSDILNRLSFSSYFALILQWQRCFAQKYGLACLSIGGVMRMVLHKHEHTDLAVQMKKHLSQGLTVPDELAIQCLEVALMSSVCSTLGYVFGWLPEDT
ncbi:hypothetical protein F7725_019603 [Dissostichus mawsoni]|uniref:Uncharacterized protein n=1 Tax=Dissostichus mawsoni TaxID=36200 RepID=A0A7J5YK73_DISMA|nr:hypothetical protein F7725_019603 [Dissostichus mawsoni]